MTTLEIAAGGAALVGLWALLLIASWLEDLVFPGEHRGESAAWPGRTERPSWDLPVATAATPAVVAEPTIAAPPAAHAA